MADDETLPPSILSLSPTLVLQVVTWIVAGVLTYAAINTRVTVVENKVEQQRQDISEIKADVKQLLRRP